jgi:hypothetical protein
VIPERDLNVVESGPGVYGAEAASRRHFAKAAAIRRRMDRAGFLGRLVWTAPRWTGS